MFNNKRARKNSKKNKGSGTRSSRVLSAMLAAVMAVALLLGIPAGNMGSVQAATTLKNPRKGSNGVVTWDCIYFGNFLLRQL